MMSQFQKLKDKIIERDALLTAVEELKREGKKIVFTNGCFDLLHKGHVTYLAKAADEGDVLVLGLNSDASVRRQGKGDDRPINDFLARATVIAGLGFIDFVIEFDDDTPEKLIQAIVPSVLVKGGDYHPEETDRNSKQYIVGREAVLKNGGAVKTINLVDGFSTTGIIKKMRNDD